MQQPFTEPQRRARPADLGGALPVMRRTLVYAALICAALFVYFVALGSYCRIGCHLGFLRIALTTGHIALIVGFVVLTVRVLRRDRLMIFSPVTGFLVSTALFFGFGSLSTFMADPITRSLLAAGNYDIDEPGMLRTDALTMFGAAFVLVGLNLGSRLPLGSLKRRERSVSLPAVAVIFLVCGFVLKYGLLIPARWGVIDVVVPGTLNNLQQLPDLGFLLVAYAMARGMPGMRILFLLLWPPHLLLCLLEFSKTAVMFAILLPALGGFLAHRRLARVLPWVAFGALLFAVSQNINTQARIAVIEWGGVEDRAPLPVRARILLELLEDVGPDAMPVTRAEDVAPQMWWMRLNNSGPQLRAMELHELGDTAGWMISPVMYVVPRFIWHDKPEMVSPGQEFNRTVSRNDMTIGRVAITVYGEGYWIGGWLGAAVLSLLTGLILGAMTRSSYQLLQGGNLLFLPAVLMATGLGAIGVNGFFQTNIVGGSIIYLAYLLTVRLGLALFLPRTDHGNERAALSPS